MRRAYSRRLVAAAAASALVLAACGGNDDASSGSGGATGGGSAKIGFMGDLTGANAQLGINIRNGAKLAIDQYNATNPAHQDRADRVRHPGRPDAGDHAGHEGHRTTGRRHRRPGVLR